MKEENNEKDNYAEGKFANNTISVIIMKIKELKRVNTVI